LKALRAPLNDVDFLPTGGVNADNLADYVRAGAAAVGLGGSLITGPHQEQAELTTRARRLTASLRAARAELEQRRA